MNIPEAPAQIKAIADSLVGLPFVCLVEDPRSAARVVCQMRNGTKLTAAQIEETFNAGLVIEAIEGAGAATRQTEDPTSGGSKIHAEILSHAERLFGISIREALPLYLQMQRYEYVSWADRPRVKWPRPQVN
jgi:hypothetical protein